MTILTAAIAALAGCLILVHLLSVSLAARRCRAVPSLAPRADAPAVSLIRPICGLENNLEETLRSSFRLDYPRYEVIFCAASADDAAVAVARRVMADHPDIPSRLLIGNDVISTNPKLNNVCKGWRAAAFDWAVMADSNVLMPPDYIQRLMAAWRDDTGVVCSPATGSVPTGFWAELECAFLNTYEVRWQYTAVSFGFGFAQGKTMLFHRPLLDALGGMEALASEPAEDAAVTKIVRSAGRHVRLVNAPFLQPLGWRRAADVWNRQVRWARLRRASFRSFFALEILTSGALPLLAAVFLVVAADVSPVIVPACALLWYGGEAFLARVANWPLTWRSLLAWMLRDALLPALWVSGWMDSRFIWRGNTMRATEYASPA